MPRILPDIRSLEQHHRQLQLDPESYRPPCCPHCGRHGVWCHGSYARRPDRATAGPVRYLPIAIPRYLCPACRRTCACLPECLPPRRWYRWVIQQPALAAASDSLRALARRLLPDRRTLGRWIGGWRAAFGLHAFCLRDRFPDLGRQQSLATLWAAALAIEPLSALMLGLHRAGVAIP